MANRISALLTTLWKGHLHGMGVMSEEEHGVLEALVGNACLELFLVHPS